MGTGKGNNKRIQAITSSKSEQKAVMLKKIKQTCFSKNKHLVMTSIMGSHAYDLAHADSDIDYRSVYLLPLKERLGIHSNTTTLSLGDNVDASHDVVLYEFVHFCQLASKGNPNILEILFTNPEQNTKLGEYLLNNKDIFLSQKAKHAYHGFVLSCLKRYEKEITKGDNERKILKNIRHGLRIGLQGEELLTTGKITVALNKTQKELIQKIEKATPAEVVEQLNEQLTKLKTAPSILPPQVDITQINQFIYETYQLID